MKYIVYSLALLEAAGKLQSQLLLEFVLKNYLTGVVENSYFSLIMIIVEVYSDVDDTYIE